MDNRIGLVAERLKNNYFEFFKFFWPLYSSDEMVTTEHIKHICNELQEVSQHIINRTKPDYDWYIVNVPPGSSKSSMVSVMWPLYLLAHDPSILSINSSYSADLSASFVRKSKKIIDSDSFKMLFGNINLTKETESQFETHANGGRYSTSTGGTIVGMHGNVIIIDDPLSVEMSYSKANRDRANRFITTTLPERVRDKEKTPIILIMQRLHEDDPTGHILKKGVSVKHICLPAELGANTTKGLEHLYTDGLLDPKRMSKEVLSKKKAQLGSFGYSGQYDQSPYPEGGGKIKGEWFDIVHENELPTDIIWDLWIDGAYTKNTANDPTGLLVTGYKDNRLYIKHAFDAFLEMPGLLAKIPGYAEANGLTQKSRVYIEPKASGKSLKQLLKQDTNLNAVEITSFLVNEGKEARIQTAAPSVEAGRVTLVRGGWNDNFIHQLEAYPNGKHDEYVDLLGYAVFQYMKKRQTW